MWGKVRVKLFFEWAPLLASALRKRWAKFKNPRATVEFGRYTYVGPGFSLHAPLGGTFVVGKGCEFRRGFRCELGGADTVVRFGDNCVATYDMLMQVTTSVEIGDRVMFGQTAAVFDGKHNFKDPDVPMLDQGYDFKPLRIEDDVTILTKCTIVANIGRRAVVAANTVVSRDVEPFHVVGGVPGKVIGTFGPAANGAAVGSGSE
jgi:galactoside O-acetyltransferase